MVLLDTFWINLGVPIIPVCKDTQVNNIGKLFPHLSSQISRDMELPLVAEGDLDMLLSWQILAIEGDAALHGNTTSSKDFTLWVLLSYLHS